MPSRTKKFRGTRTHGRGKKAGRGAGLHGGTGNAGLHKHKVQYMLKFMPDHFGRHGFKINVVTIPEGSERIDSIRGAYRTRQDIRTIVVDGSPFSSLEIVAALRRGEIVAMLVDRWEGTGGVTAKFFGEDRRFPRGPFVLSRATGAPNIAMMPSPITWFTVPS